MSMRMLIDARHPEETRVAVVKGNRIEEFDFESAEHKQLKGNIYLAKVTRVEPSLQAAFVDYGGNRHGFLAFSEIHPDYYQIPKADREALLREEAEHAAEEERLRSASNDFEVDGDGDDHDDDVRNSDDSADERSHDEEMDAVHETATATEAGTGSDRSPVDESAADELRKKRQALRRRYKIQDVIQRRQVLLVQVVKEERGNKGAALTTYLSLAGRYCVLMPNTSHGGGISRKISGGADRKRLKSIMSDLNLPKSMGLIVRTAGLSRTKTEIKRDFDYLARLWDEIRENTLGSTAPALIYRDSDLIKRAIRDLYHREIDEVLVEGEDGYKQARKFMKLLMPSHVRRVKQHSDTTPLFQRYGVEDQLSAMYQPIVQLKSGGYLVINPTEALVSIDINSGRSTREHNIEQTAFMTNIEAAAEIARQLRLRDMAGLVVIDFIDMEQSSHIRKVEKAMKEALKSDRARIQVGRISGFGLMEMSRQRLRTGVLEASTKACPHCEGTGLMRTASSSGLSALRMIEDEAARGRGDRITLRAGREAAVYVLNKKRSELAEIEQRYAVAIEILIDEHFEGAKMTVESSGPRPNLEGRSLPLPVAAEPDEDDEDIEISLEEDDEDGPDENEGGRGRSAGQRDDGGGNGEDEGRRRRRRRRGGRGRGRRNEQREGGSHDSEDDAADLSSAQHPTDDAEGDKPAGDRKRNRRGRRGKGSREPIAPDSAPMIETPLADEQPISENEPTSGEEGGEAKPKTKKRPRARKAEGASAEDEATAKRPAEQKTSKSVKPAPKSRSKKAAKPGSASEDADSPKEKQAKPARKPRAKKAESQPEETDQPEAARKTTVRKATSATSPPAVAAGATIGADQAGDGNTEESRRGGWWQRTFG